MLTKKELRRQMSELKKCHCSTLAYHTQSADALSVLERHPAFVEAHTVLLYHSLPDEVFTHDFIDRWITSKCVLLPVVTGNDLQLRRYTGRKDLAVGAFGIEEPSGEPFTDYHSIDLVVVPGVAFDAAGNRLGRGRGYYDRLLPRLPRARKIGICFPFQMVERVPAEDFDIRMDEVVTAQTCGELTL